MATYNISLADLRQDIAGAIPVDIVLRWNESDKTGEQHARILDAFRVRGTIVSSDSAGLSKLTQRLTLPQVMQLVSQPKELVFAYGKAIGGEAIGVWAADNTQMFYPETVNPAQVLEQMLAVQQKGRELTVKVGMGMHFAECYQVAGGLFGREADFIEDIAEDATAGGEIVFSRTVFDHIPAHLREAATVRADLAEHGEIWSIRGYEGPLDARAGDDVRYPFPFDDVFFKKLRTSTLEQLGQDDCEEYRKVRTVAFVKLVRPHQELLLNAFTEMSLIDLSVRRVASLYKSEVVKSTGSLAIVLFESEEEAVSFSRDVIETNRALGFRAHVGIVKGEVYLFPLTGGGSDIAGNPVNIASKLSEDSGLDGVLVESSGVTEELARQGQPFDLKISGVSLTGRQISV